MTDPLYRADRFRVLVATLLVQGLMTCAQGPAQVQYTPVPIVTLEFPRAGVSSVSQFGITWTFSTHHEVGQFANGDWWVVGPVSITNIDPPSSNSGGRTINGSMIDPRAGSDVQGFDSSMYAQYGSGLFNQSLNVALNVSASNPLRLDPGKSLVSTISIPQANSLPQLKTAAILTCLASAPPPNSFRPPYVAGNKAIRFNASQLRYHMLAALTPVPSTPALSTVERYFERPWIDHVSGWLARYMHPADNMPDYGRDMSTRVGIGALMLHLNFSNQQKRNLLVRYVQLGIDLQGFIDAGARRNWTPDGGHASGRKWPILFAGLLLGDPTMSAIGSNSSVIFGEDAQTFVVRETSPGVYNFGYGGYVAADVGMPEWGIRHATNPSADAKGWEIDPYRTCCTANAWSGFVLAARIMGQTSAWNHDELFSYMDRYLQVETIAWRRFWDAGFTAQMWQTYRSSFN